MPVLLLSLASCRGCEKKPSAQWLADAAPLPSFDESAPVASAFATDALWTRALQKDPIDLAALADREGASGLLEAMEQGGPVGLASMQALPLAEDAELAYRRLAQIALQADDEARLLAIDVIYQIANRPLLTRESLDPEGVKLAAQALRELARSGDSNKERALATSALRMLSDRYGLGDS